MAKSDVRVRNAIMRALTPPTALTPYQIKQEAKRRGLWFDVLKPALEADPDVYEDFLIASEIGWNNEIVNIMTDLMKSAEDPEAILSEYKDHFWREAAARWRV